MHRTRIWLAAAFLPLTLILVAGCGGFNAYNPDLAGSGGVVGDFIIQAFAGDSATVGDGTGKTPISQSNPAEVTSGGTGPVTIVVKSVNGFTGSVTLSAGQATGPFTVTQPAPQYVYPPANGAAESEMSFTNANALNKSVKLGRGNVATGTAVITATSGTTTKTLTVFFRISTATPDFTVTVYNGTAQSVGDGTGKTPNSTQNRLTLSPPGGAGPITVVVKSTNGFTGTATISQGQASSGFFAGAPNPYMATLTSGGFAGSQILISSDQEFGANHQGQVVITVTSGSTTHTATAYFVTANGGS